MMTNVFFISVRERKKIKHFAKRSFSVFRGLPWASPNTLKLIFGKLFYYFFSMLMKNIFSIISRFFLQKIVDLVQKCVFKLGYILN